MLLLIDNYDSFVYNLAQYFGELGQEVKVVRNDELTPQQLGDLAPDYLVLSPGPCTPKDAGVSVDAVKYFAARAPILGVCLGHQSIAQAFGGDVVPAQQLMHGKTSLIEHDARGMFDGLPSPLKAARYHSLAVKSATLPDCLQVTARTDDGEIMGLRHAELPICGVQFHPESILTEHGHAMLRRFLNLDKPCTTS